MKLKALSLSLALATVAHAQLPQVLAKLDQSAASFRNAQADVHYDTNVLAAHVHEIQTGKLYVERKGISTTMGAVLYDEGEKSPAMILAFDGKKIHRFAPGTSTDETYSAGNNKAKIETFLTLGFGGSGKDLAANWNITDGGSENIGSIKTEKLDLVAKDPGVLSTVKHITIWVDLTRGVSLRQQMFTPDGNIKTADYTNVRTNTALDDAAKAPFTIPKKGVTVQAH